MKPEACAKNHKPEISKSANILRQCTVPMQSNQWNILVKKNGPSLTTTKDIISVICTVASRVSKRKNILTQTPSSDMPYALAAYSATMSVSLPV